MRVAIYHNLPPGGALRLLHEFVRRSCGDHEYDLYSLDLCGLDDFAYARDRAEQHDVSAYVSRTFRYSVAPVWAARALAGKPWRLTAPFWMDRVQRRIAADINRRAYDVALVHPCSITHTPGLLRHLTVPSLHYMQEHRRRTFEAGYQAADAGAPPLRRAVSAGLERVLRASDRAAAQAAERIICNSSYSAECIQRSYGRDAVVCHPGVDTEVFDLAGAPADPADRPSVMSVGALEPVKGHDLVVRALALLPPASRPALDLVYERCDFAHRAELVALATSSGIELRLHAGIPDGELARLYGSAAATVVAARLEPFGLVPLESMACGAPVVAVREAGYRETVQDGVNGYLVDRSAAQIAAAVARALSGGLRRTRQDIRATVVPQWDWDGAVKRQLEQLAITADSPGR